MLRTTVHILYVKVLRFFYIIILFIYLRLRFCLCILWTTVRILYARFSSCILVPLVHLTDRCVSHSTLPEAYVFQRQPSSLIACTGRFCRSILLFYAHMGRFRSLILCSTPIGEVLTLYFMFYVRMGGSAPIFCVLRLYGRFCRSILVLHLYGEVPLLYFVIYCCMGRFCQIFHRKK